MTGEGLEKPGEWGAGGRRGDRQVMGTGRPCRGKRKEGEEMVTDQEKGTPPRHSRESN